MRTKVSVLDWDSIVLQVLKNYHTSSKNEQIRRANLWALSNKQKGDIPPASFQRCLKRLENLHILHCNKIGKTTIIVFNVDTVNSFLKKKEDALVLNFQNLTEEVEPETWESIFETLINKNMSLTSSTPSQSHSSNLGFAQSLIANAYSGMWAIVLSRSLELLILQDSWNKVKLERKEAIEDLIKAVMRFAVGNPDEPFKITVEFNGLAKTRAKASNELYHQIIQKIMPQLLLFSEHIMKHKFSKRDQSYLHQSVLHCLSARSRKCVDTFMDRISELEPKFGQDIA